MELPAARLLRLRNFFPAAFFQESGEENKIDKTGVKKQLCFYLILFEGFRYRSSSLKTHPQYFWM